MKQWLMICAAALLLTACSTETPIEPPGPATTSTPSPAPNAGLPLQEVLKEMGFSRSPNAMTLIEQYRQEADGSISSIATFGSDKSVITAGGYEPKTATRRLIPSPKGDKLWLTFYCTVQEPTATLDKGAIKGKVEQVLSMVTERRKKFEKETQPRITLKGDRLAHLDDYPGCRLNLQP